MAKSKATPLKLMVLGFAGLFFVLAIAARSQENVEMAVTCFILSCLSLAMFGLLSVERLF